MLEHALEMSLQVMGGRALLDGAKKITEKTCRFTLRCGKSRFRTFSVFLVQSLQLGLLSVQR